MFKSRVVGLVAICLCIIIVLGYVNVTAEEPRNIEDPVSTPVESWQTYRNDLLGYEISYPPDWSLGESISMGYPYVIIGDPIAQAQTLEQGLIVNQGASIEIRAEEFTSKLPAVEYIKYYARTGIGPDGTWLDVETAEFASTVWGYQGYHLIHRSGNILQHNHAALIKYQDGELLLQIILTVIDAPSSPTEAYNDVYNQIINNLSLNPSTNIPTPLLVDDSSSLVIPDAIEDEMATSNGDQFLMLPFYSNTEMHVQQGWYKTYDNPTHQAIDYIKGTIESSPWQPFDVLAAAGGKACMNCATGPDGSESVWIEHEINGKTYFTYYGHFSAIEKFLEGSSRNDMREVYPGQKIGTAGSTGVVNKNNDPQPGWIHLHFQVKNSSDIPVDPYDLHTYRDPYFPNPTATKMGADHLFKDETPPYFGGDSGGGGTGDGTTVDVVEIIDSSGSMSTNDPFNRRKDAGKTYVDTSINGDYVGIVDFDSSTRLASPLVRIPENQGALHAAIDTINSSGGTNIGAGIQAGCDALIASNSTNAKKGAIFLTDGIGSYNNQAQCFIDRSWPIYAFGLDSADDALLDQIATSTGGEYTRLPTSNLVCEFQRVRAKISGVEPTPCQSTLIHMLQDIYYLVRVRVRQAQITFSTSWGGSDVEMSLISPSGRIIDRTTTADDVLHDLGSTYEVFTIKDPEPGEWKVKLHGADVPPEGEEVVFGFTGIPKPDPSGQAFLPMVVNIHAVVPQFTCSEEIENNGFEWDGNWIIPVTEYSARYSTEQVYAGSRSMKTGITNPNQNKYSYSAFRQMVSIPSDAKSAILDVRLWRQSTESSATNSPEPVFESHQAGQLPLEKGVKIDEGFPEQVLGKTDGDVQYVLVLNQNEEWIGTIKWQTKNAPEWTHKIFDLMEWKGQNIYLHFGTYNDGINGITSMHVDEAYVVVCK